MWPIELNSVSGGTVLDSIAAVGSSGGTIDAVQSLAPVERIAIGFLATLVVSVVVLGLVHGYGTRTVTKCRRSPVISLCIGLPSVLVAGLVLFVGNLLLGTSIGVFFGIPVLAVGLTVVPAMTAIGFVAIGQSIAARVGTDRLSIGVVVGSLVAGLTAIALPVAVVGLTIAAAFGMGASVRILFGARGAADPDERTVPPANQI